MTYIAVVRGPAKRFGRELRALRERRRLSQEELSRKAGIAREGISKLETGREGIGIKRLARLAKALRVKQSTLMKYWEGGR